MEQRFIVQHAAAKNGCGLDDLGDGDDPDFSDDEERVAVTRCLLMKRQRNHFDLVALCDMPVDKYEGDNWIVEEYFVDHTDDYLVSLPPLRHR